jgi:flagellar biosynthetic protein FliP
MAARPEVSSSTSRSFEITEVAEGTEKKTRADRSFGRAINSPLSGRPAGWGGPHPATIESPQIGRPDRLICGRLPGRPARTWGSTPLRVAFFALFAGIAHAAAAPQASVMGIQLSKSGESLSVPMQIVILLTLLTLLPALVMSITPFLRIAIVLHFLRQALGTQTVPSNQVLVGIALFLTMLVISPVAADMYHQGWEPLQNNKLTVEQAFDAGSKPLKDFLVRFAREKDVKLFLEITKSPAPHSPADLELRILIPAYILSELKAGFQIGAVLFLPFLIIDMVVASVTLSIGMVQLPPVMLSAPFKILLFVLADGWNLVIGSLMKGFYA